MIVCERMYGWAADWLLEVLGRIDHTPTGRERKNESPKLRQRPRLPTAEWARLY